MANLNLVKTVYKPFCNQSYKFNQFSNQKTDLVQTMFAHFEKHKFLTRNQKKNTLVLDFNSANLKMAIKNEWLLTHLNLSDHPTFTFDSLTKQENFKNAFTEVKNYISAVPFGLVDINTVKSGSTNNLSKNCVTLEDAQYQFKNQTFLKNYLICSPQFGVEYFHRQQRERKIWWRKFAALPSRFLTTEICTDEETKSQYAEIKAEFPWGVQTVEVIRYLPEYLSFDAAYFELVKYPKKKMLPQVITCETSVEKAAFIYLCDSYERIDDGQDTLRFSKKLAPYKVAFTAQKNASNLRDLAVLLAKKIKKCEIQVFMFPDFHLASFDTQLARNDALGIPYTIILNETTLKDGIIKLRSRDTTLCEESHVSLVVPYIEKILKSG